MKLQLDTKNKTITIEESIKLDEFFQMIKKLLPDEWKQYRLEIKNIINWVNPIVIEKEKINPWITYIQPPPFYTNKPELNEYEITCYNLDMIK